jgi:hypothetical protein
MAVERTAEMRLLSLPQLKYEGGSVAFDDAAGERFVFNAEHIELGLGYVITRKACDDNLYKSEFPASNLGLQDSFVQAEEIYAANVLNTCTTVQTSIGGDGVALASTAHPIDGGTYANTFTVQLDLNEASLLSALTQTRVNFKNQAGLKILARGQRLIVPPQLQWVAARLVHSEMRPGTSDNDVNAMRATGSLPDGYEVMDFLTSNYAWFLQTNHPGLRFFERKPFEMSMEVDFQTDNLQVKGYQRYVFTYTDPKAVFCSTPTS